MCESDRQAKLTMCKIRHVPCLRPESLGREHPPISMMSILRRLHLITVDLLTVEELVVDLVDRFSFGPRQ